MNAADPRLEELLCVDSGAVKFSGHRMVLRDVCATASFCRDRRLRGRDDPASPGWRKIRGKAYQKVLEVVAKDVDVPGASALSTSLSADRPTAVHTVQLIPYRDCKRQRLEMEV